MRNSTASLVLRLFVVMALAFVCLFLFQSAWLNVIMSMVNSNQSAGLPAATTPISGFSIPTARPPAQPGVELTVNNLGITVTRVVRPADYAVADKNNFKNLKPGEEYMMVAINVRCISSSESCRLTEFDFGVKSSRGADYPAEFSTSFSDVKNLFEGGEIQPGKNQAGYLVFIIQQDDRGLTLVYPRMYNFGGPTAEFLLGQ